MSSHKLLERIVGLADRQIARALCSDPPRAGVGEVSYTREVLYPVLASLVGTLSDSKLNVGGDGSAYERLVVPLPGVGVLIPDLYLTWEDQPLVAYEVKLPKEHLNGTQAFATGIGQAFLYLKICAQARLAVAGMQMHGLIGEQFQAHLAACTNRDLRLLISPIR